MDDLLRQYEPSELGKDGYPHAWHHESQAADQSNRYHGDEPLLNPPIKDLIREQAQNRCERCWHPYEKGMGKWSPCDEGCKHGGPIRTRSAADPVWLFHERIPMAAGEAIHDEGPGGVRMVRWDVQAAWRILTVHHLDEDKANCRWWNLIAACQRCHLRMQRAVVMDRPYHFEHSTWFQPYAAGFYAFKYLGEDLDRTETMARLDEFLALERRFTQEVLL